MKPNNLLALIILVLGIIMLLRIVTFWLILIGVGAFIGYIYRFDIQDYFDDFF